MSTATETADALHGAANHLYWNSDETVDQLAQRLGMSRHALYASVQPIAADATCEACEGVLEFTNRSSRNAGRATCIACGAEAFVEFPRPEETTEETGESPEPMSDATTGDAITGDVPTVENGRLRRIPERAAKIGGAAALGAAIGVAAVAVTRRKR